MCEHCVTRGRKLFESLSISDEEKHIIRLAIQADASNSSYDRGMEQGETDQRESDEAAYKKKVVPVRETLIAAVNHADDRARNETVSLVEVFAQLVQNVRRDADRIPLKLPRA